MTTTSQADINTNTTTNAFINGAIVGGVSGGGGGGGSGDSNIGNDGGVDASSRKSGMPSSANVVNNKNFNASNSNSSTGNTNSNNFLNNPNQNTGGGTNYQRATGDAVKRKKLKSRNAAIPNNIGGGGYSGKDHLDAWLETCLKDASNTQLSSSSEFLDYNPTATMPSTTATNNSNINKNMMAQQQQQQQQQISSKQQGQQQSAFQQSFPSSNMHSTNQQQFSYQQQQPQQQQQQQFAMRTNIQTPMLHSGAYSNAPFSQGFQRSMPNFMKHSHTFNNRSMMFPAGIDGAGVSGVGGFYQQNDGSQDFASLPPIVNMMGGSSELENNSTDVLDGSGSNPNICRGFRFSDPCLLNPSDNDSKISGQNTPDPRNHIPNDMENNKFFTALMEQINLLHETNTKICRNLHETKVDIEALKHAPTWGMRHRRDSLSGLSTHSQPMIFGGGFGTQSPAPTYHSGAYTPGMMTDVVREVKEAARVREDALLNRVKSMVEERQWSMNECNLRMMRDIEELKSQVHHLRVDRKEANKRINHLDAENKYMRQMLANIFNTRNAPDVIYENQALRTRKTFPHSRRTQSLNLNYGTIHHQPPATSLSVEEQDEASSSLHIIESPSITSTADNVSVQHQEQQLQQQQQQRPSDMRNSFSSSDGGGSMSGGGGCGATPLINGAGGGSSSTTGQIMSPPNFALVSSPADELKRNNEKFSNRNAENLLSLKHTPNEPAVVTTTQDLETELHNAVAARKEADNRIIALEKLVKTLRVNTSAATTTHLMNGGGDDNNLSGGDGIINPCTIKITTATTTQSHHKTLQQQQQQQHHKAHTIASSSVNMSQSSPKLSVAGPITDL